MRRNKCLFWAVMAGTLVLAVLLCRNREASDYRLEIVNIGTDAYGYRILRKEQTVVYQPFVPALSGKQSFRSEGDARKVGELVLQRLQSGDDFMITVSDLQHLGIHANR